MLSFFDSYDTKRTELRHAEPPRKIASRVLLSAWSVEKNILAKINIGKEAADYYYREIHISIRRAFYLVPKSEIFLVEARM